MNIYIYMYIYNIYLYIYIIYNIYIYIYIYIFTQFLSPDEFLIKLKKSSARFLQDNLDDDKNFIYFQ